MTRPLKIAVLAGVFTAISACAPTASSPSGVGLATHAVLLSPAEQASALDDIMRADRAFSDMAQTVGVAEAFAEFMDRDGKVLGAGETPAVGTEAIFALFAAFPDDALFSWSPVEGYVAASGDLGVTWGTYELGFPDEDGNVDMSTGRYLTVWRKDEVGRWRGFLDIGT